MQTPRRFRILDSMGRERTLATGCEAFERCDDPPASPHSRAVLLLGLGPNPQDALPLTEGAARVAFVESPSFERALAEASLSAAPLPSPSLNTAPATWLRLRPEDILHEIRTHRPVVWAYRQAVQLFPEFWGPLLGRLRASRLRPAPRSQTVLLPGTERDLLHLELADALRAEGFHPIPLPPNTRGKDLLRILEREAPAFLLSVNLRGLDPAGEVFHLLQALEVPVALWFVDNPWHILSALRLPWWKQAFLFTTDATFIPDLKAQGAEHVYPLPLAASSLFTPAGKLPEFPAGKRLFFAGRSSFPDRDRFFAAAHPNAERAAQAAALPPGVAHFHWWANGVRLWPGADVRAAGAGAETESLRWRTAWLREGAKIGLATAGDEGWATLLGPDATLLPPVDYYTELPGWYCAAPYTLNVTSLLLPGGLTQRHFDVWNAGGFLLTNRTSGLDIFPAELVDPITLDAPTELSDRVLALDAAPKRKHEIRKAWKNILINAHSYQHRIRSIAQHLGVSVN